MPIARLIAGTALAVAAVGLPTSSAFAAGGGVEVNPSTAAPGSVVTVNTTGCGRSVSAADGDSTAGGEFQLATGTHKGDLVGQFTVPAGTKAGSYGVGVICPDGTKLQSTFTVSAGSRPTGTMKTGIGSTSQGSNSTQIAVGAGVLAAVAAGAMVMRRRRTDGRA
ncbi:hypothetical protein G3I19_13565 [Streptomyces sp. SID10853]|uniref:hypothetical protein n=1 Tax=Streptomyces sp. SID10853 TaxID=2706028 RepID=UPI0013C0052A|nr:hypothetical protein [Streptomyces sp. SID10853]NDZ79528.1 hypothetical protein [Streptomyces sp. SID10853]